MPDTTGSHGTDRPDDSVATGVPGRRPPVLTGSARLHPDRGAARRARSLMAEWLTSWWGPAALDTPSRAHLRDRLALVLSELVSNAVVHGGRGREVESTAQLEIELHEFDGVARLVVADRGRRPGDAAFRPPPETTLPATVADSGRGLFIVDRLADIWHAQPVSDGLVVWCDFSLDGRPLPTAGPAAAPPA